jgi:hypothetical protein
VTLHFPGWRRSISNSQAAFPILWMFDRSHI